MPRGAAANRAKAVLYTAQTGNPFAAAALETPAASPLPWCPASPFAVSPPLIKLR